MGVSAPPQGVYLPNPIQPVFRLPTAPVSGESPHHRLVASDRRIQELEQAVAATRQTISALCDGGIRPPQSLFDSASSLSRDLEDAKQSSFVFHGESRPLLHSLGFRHLPSVSLLPRLSSQVLRVQKATLRPLVHLGDGLTTHLRVQLDILLARRVILLPARGVGSRTIRLPMRMNRLTLAGNGTISRMTRTIFVLLRCLFCWTTSPRSFQLPPSP